MHQPYTKRSSLHSSWTIFADSGLATIRFADETLSYSTRPIGHSTSRPLVPALTIVQVLQRMPITTSKSFGFPRRIVMIHSLSLQLINPNRKSWLIFCIQTPHQNPKTNRREARLQKPCWRVDIHARLRFGLGFGTRRWFFELFVIHYVMRCSHKT